MPDSLLNTAIEGQPLADTPAEFEVYAIACPGCILFSPESVPAR
jgi:hypothetical protein